jgi:hypothetical protein
MTQAPRQCPKCREPRPWRKDRPPGSRCARRLCLTCGAATNPIHGRRKSKTMPAPLYRHRQRVKECDALWSRIILSRPGPCECCGKSAPAYDPGHNIGRKRCLATRHDPDNGAKICRGCHRRIDEDAEEKRALFLRLLGPERYERLQMIKKCGGRVDLQLVAIGLRALLGERKS